MAASISADTSIVRSRRDEYTALALMYFAQGLPAGLAFDALGTLIRHGGHSVAAVGLTGFAFLPWALKFLWAGPVDNACVRWGYRRVILWSQLLIAACCAALAPFSPAAGLYMTLAGVLLLNTLCATQDIATNAYAVARMQGRRAGAANGIQVAGFILGMLAGGGGLLVVHDRLGWAGAMLVLTVVMLGVYLCLRLASGWDAAPIESPIASPLSSPPSSSATPRKARLRDLARHVDLRWALLIALCFKFASTAVSTLSKPWLVDRPFTLAEVGVLQMSNLLATALGGVLIGIPLVRALGPRKAVVVAAAVATMTLGAAWLLEFVQVRSLPAFMLAFGIQSLCDGAMYVTIWALFMNWASREQPGTDYTAMQSCESISNALAAGFIGSLGQALGYGAAFAWSWAAGALVLLILAISVRRLAVVDDAGRVS